MLNKDAIIKSIGLPLYSSTKVACCLFDSDLNFVFVNHAFCTLSEYSKEELTGHSLSVLLSEEILKKAYDELKYALENETVREFKWPYFNKSGEKCWTSIDIHILEINGSKYSFIITNDISKESQLETKLEEESERLRALIDASPLAIYSIDTEGIIRDFWNPAAEKLLGWKREEVIGKFLPHVSEDHQDEFSKVMQITKENGFVNKIVTRKNKAGEEIIVDITGGCLFDDKGQISEILVTMMDVTELETNRNRLKQSLEEKETLLQEIHHRVKNNLAIVVSLLQLQVFRSEDETEKYRLTEAQNRVHSIAMVHELLYESDQFSKVNLENYYNKLINTIRNNMIVTGQEVETRLDINLNSLNINQAIPLGLLINELATNSFKYAFTDSEEESNIITLKIDRDEDTIHVHYTDNGSGFDMAEEYFEAGLGLKIIDSLLNQLGSDFKLNTDGKFSLKLSFEEKNKGPIARNS